MKRLLSILLVLSITVLAVACVQHPKTPEDAVKNLEKAGYSVDVVDNADEIKMGLISLGIEELPISTLVVGTSEESNDLVMISFCENEDDAKKVKEGFEFYLNEGIKNFAEKNGGSIDDIFIDLENYEVQRIDNIVAFGHKDMIKATKG